MDFNLSEKHKHIQSIARKFSYEEIAPVALERDKISDWEKRMPWDLTEKASKLGLRQLPYPEQYGGLNGDVVSCCLAGEELAVGDLGFAVNLDQTWKLAHILEKVDPHVRDPWLKRLCEEPRFLAAIPMTEPDCGSDHQGYYDDVSIALNTFAHKKNGKWVINGQKRYISNGPVASLYVVAARTDKNKNLREGLSGFLVPRETKGISIGEVNEKIGQRLSMNSEIFFDNVEIPEDHIILGEGSMFEIRGNLLSMGKPEAAATALGVGRAAFEHALSHAQERVQGGKIIGKHQAIEMMLADMAMNLDIARNYILKTAWAVDNQKPYDYTQGWKCKIFASETAFECARLGVEIFGGAGIMQSSPMEKYLRDASTFLHSDGTNQLLRLRIGKTYFQNLVSRF
jgi:alkylation response protein AidB-like acyl-CoA dehydrogenase